MKKMILTAVMLAAAALCRAQQPAETGERREWLTSFTAVEVSAPLDVKFVQVPDTEAPKIVYDTKGSYTTKFRAEVKDKVLRITERSDARRPDRTSVTVYYNSLERVAIADAVGDRVMVLVDGGIRTGLDVFKALALGADGVLIGRPFVTMVYGGGEEGVAAYVRKLTDELSDTMAMCGAHSLKEIDREMLWQG